MSRFSACAFGRALSRTLKKRYDLAEIPEEIVELFDEIGKKRGCLMAGGEINYDKTTEVIIRDIRTEKFGPLSFEKPAD